MKNLYRTTLLEVATFLLLKGAKLLDLEKLEGTAIYSFVFEDPDECEKLKKDYINGALVNASLYNSKRKYLLEMISDKKRQLR